MKKYLSIYKYSFSIFEPKSATGSACAFNIQLTKKINTIATNELVELSVKHGVVKFIYASTCSVYGINEKLCSENTEPKPISEYARSKLEGKLNFTQLKIN